MTGVPCKCVGSIEEKMKHWVISVYKGNYSAFNGYKFTPSKYSEIRCEKCLGRWRTKANYVYHLKNVNL